MGVLASFLQMIADLIARVAGVLLSWFQGLFAALWTASVTLLGSILGWILDLFAFLVNLSIDIFFLFLTFLASLLPPVPDPPDWYVDALAPYLGLLNTFFPVSEVLTAASVWAAVYGAIFLYKGIKFLRGGG
ncbi:hypothetical protein [Oceanithermus sp.]